MASPGRAGAAGAGGTAKIRAVSENWRGEGLGEGGLRSSGCR